ncbi:hypothetical protein [Sporomusa malonica]|uniref:Host cell surface-exposed lipoprotein n=1 Tax=Sporomusa malonica TaxID=112901 RepID=A0A1W2E4R5_9FIRM|nr:hypothetical protein [Sporomusa malonica]SMD04730.1 hypothetical protein SAMN04488500_12086 [Sporomusa malonica]
MLSTNTRKTIAAFVAGAFILAGIASPLVAQATSFSKERPAHHQRHHQVNPEQAAKRLAADFGLDEALIAKYQKEGKHFKDLRRAAFFAKVSDQSFESVLALKTDKNTWKEVATTLGIDKGKAKAVRQELAAKHIAEKFSINQGDIQTLFNQGYHHRDVAMAGLLAKQSGQAIDEIMAKKKVNNTWQDVGSELGIDLKALKKDMRKSWKNKNTKE